MSLKVIVVGAGIAGLCAATSLRQAGHKVEIFEKSVFATEVGAAVALTPNGARVLSRLGFSFARARACKVQVWDTLLGDTLTRVGSIDLSMAEKRFGAAAWAVHRVDLHSELLRLATSEDAGDSNPAILRLGTQVVSVSSEGSIALLDGSRHSADLIVAADGLHSNLRGTVLGEEIKAASPAGLSAFRFLIDTKVLNDDAKLASLLEAKGPGAAILIDIKETVRERHMMWYPCRNGDVQNFVGIHPTRPKDSEDDEINGKIEIDCDHEQALVGSKLIFQSAVVDTRTSMLEEFSHFHPGIVQTIAQSSHVKCWPLYIYDPLPNWSRGRIILIGDAAHPMLPFGGQGSNQAMEDAGALGYLFKGVDDPNAIEERLSLFELARKNRASRVQVLSKARIGREKEVEQELRQYADPPGSVPTTPLERTIHDYGFDVFAKCEEVLQGQLR